MTGTFYDFPLYNDAVADPRKLIDFEEAGQVLQLAAAIHAEHEQFLGLAPGRIERGQLDVEEAKRQALVLEAIGADLAAEQRWQSEWRDYLRGNRGSAPDPIDTTANPAIAEVGWAQKVDTLRALIGARLKGRQKAITKGLTTREDVDTRIRQLEAVHEKYWRWGFAWDSTPEELALHGENVRQALFGDADTKEQEAA